MAIMNEAMSKENFERTEKGLPPIKRVVIPRPEPAFPKVPDLLKFDDIPLTEFDKVVSANVRRIQNEEKVHFIGYDVIIQLKPKRGPGRPKEDEPEPQPRILKGWMIEGEYLKLSRQK